MTLKYWNHHTALMHLVQFCFCDFMQKYYHLIYTYRPSLGLWTKVSESLSSHGYCWWKLRCLCAILAFNYWVLTQRNCVSFKKPSIVPDMHFFLVILRYQNVSFHLAFVPNILHQKLFHKWKGITNCKLLIRFLYMYMYSYSIGIKWIVQQVNVELKCQRIILHQLYNVLF
jgi:hypothetical protein